ncbi:MAG: hypothetical protein H3C43_09880 [Leptonema sp. (in: Bacteria)]|nr:hypothetical protein [Leptonema sp. (in: bacteria)]
MIPLTACFDYEERVTFLPGFSGSIDFKYSVPIDKDSGKSLIAFLPVTHEDIEKRFKVKPDEILDFKAETFESNPFLMQKVSYRILFKDAKQLETLLPGQVQILQAGGKLRLDRSFPGLESLTEGKQLRAYRIAYRSILEKLKDHSMKFSITCPWYYDMSTNQGTLPAPGTLYFVFPLERTVTQEKEMNWNIEITANSAPEEVSKTSLMPADHHL